ncbi:Lipase [Erysiphe necator]|nr:Lipase [Erysiphe necator]
MLNVVVLLTTFIICSSLTFATYFEPVNHVQVNTDNIIDLGYSQYQGVKNPVAAVKYWLGIRFAAAPLADLRWRAPVDPVVNYTLQDASIPPNVCIGIGEYGTSVQSEDCLFLNIFTPANATPSSRLPVWFFIPGGGYSVNSDPNYNATEIIKQSGGKIIVVETSFRVSAFGFLASEKIRQDGSLNVGILDQRKALKWVQKYITKFGGDPGRVVIHGDSAGAGSVAMHLIAYNGRNDSLFSGAILESVFFPTQRKVIDYEFQYNNFVSLSNCSSSNDTLACLRNTPLSILKVANSNPAPFPNATAPSRFPYAPCVDGDLITDYPAKLFLDGNFLQVPIMIGGDTDEGNDFVNNASTSNEMKQYMHNQFPKLSEKNLEKMEQLYPLMPPLPLHAPYFPSVALAYGEATFTCPGLLISSAFFKYSSDLGDSLVPIFHYHYNVQDYDLIAVGKGVPHVFELQALFNTYDPKTSSYNTYNAPIVPQVRNYWINFVMRNDPNHIINNASEGQTKIIWTPWGDMSENLNIEQRLLIQTNATQMENVSLKELERCQFWKDVIDETEI